MYAPFGHLGEGVQAHVEGADIVLTTRVLRKVTQQEVEVNCIEHKKSQKTYC